MATRLPNEFDQSNLNVWMNSEVMREMYRNQINSGNANFRNAMNEQMNYNRYQYQPAANNYLNPLRLVILYTFTEKTNSFES